MYRILIVEDDAGISGAMKKQIEMWDLEVRCVEDFHNVLGEFSAYEPHLILMDISLPFFNGSHWCAEIRKVSKIPINFVSSASDNMNIMMAINMGGDDFITKPFDQNVLIAKIQAILRRTYDYSGRVSIIEYKGAMLNMEEAILVYQGKRIELTKNEYRILLSLMKQKNKVVSREKLMEELWEGDCYVDENTLSVNINRLRKKLNSYGLFNFIVTKVGMGYCLVK